MNGDIGNKIRWSKIQPAKINYNYEEWYERSSDNNEQWGDDLGLG